MAAIASTPYRPFSISVVPDRNVVGAVPVGELDLATVDDVALTIGDLRAVGFTEIVLDLRQVDFIDSTGLRLLFQLRADAARDGHRIALVAPQPLAGRIFDITGTRDLFDWQDRFPASVRREYPTHA